MSIICSPYVVVSALEGKKQRPLKYAKTTEVVCTLNLFNYHIWKLKKKISAITFTDQYSRNKLIRDRQNFNMLY